MEPITLPPTFKPPTTIPSTSPKRCFVTVGATASFASLIRTVLHPQFLTALNQQSYRELVIQYGKDGRRIYEDRMLDMGGHDEVESKFDVQIAGFDFDSSGLRREMVEARDGCVVSHAGSGSILDALRVSTPILVVPNPELMDNHQIELAEILEKERYVVHGRLDDLADGINRIEELRRDMRRWPPVQSKSRSGGLVQVVKQEMGWYD